MTSARGAWAVVFGFALGLGYLYARPALAALAGHGLDSPVHLDGEVVSLATYGRWWLMGGGRWLGDGFSGQFPTFYNYLSDALLNALSLALAAPPTTVQAVIWGPMLAAALLVVDYAVLAAVLRDRIAALLASVLISTAGASFPFGVFRVSDLTRDLLHVPSETVALGTAQSLGWVLFLPCVGLCFLAHRRFTVGRAVAFGTTAGLLFQAHTLTFVNAAAVLLAYLVAANLAERPAGRAKRAWVGFLGALGVAFVALAVSRSSSLPALVLIGGLALAATALLDPARRFYVWGFGTALLVAAPYLAALVHYRGGMPTTGTGSAVDPDQLLLYFGAYVVAAAAAFRGDKDRDPGRWAAVMLTATLVLAFNHVWGWSHHPYRFAINLVFPLAVLAALGVRRAPRPLALVLLALVAVPSVASVRRTLGGGASRATIVDESGEAGAFLRVVREATSRPEARDAVVLNAPEHSYAATVAANAVLFSYSQRPGFVPDYRYVLTRERYFNRLGLFCFLFPGYPAFDLHLERYACKESLDPPPDVVRLRDPALRTAALPVYGIEYAAGTAHPFSRYLREAPFDYGWEILAEAPHRRFVRTLSPARPGWARLGRGRWDDNGLSVDLETDREGPHLVVLGGRRLDERADRVVLDGRTLRRRSRAPNWAVLDADIHAGSHRLELLWPERSEARDPDYLYFAAVVAADHAPESLEVPPGGNPAVPGTVSSSGDRP
jgi:hypothetical protein